MKMMTEIRKEKVFYSLYTIHAFNADLHLLNKSVVALLHLLVEGYKNRMIKSGSQEAGRAKA
jgi:hypothetical protein